MLECQMCNNLVPGVPKLFCGHFICPKCYTNEKTLNRHACCQLCNRKLKRRS